MTFGTLGGMAAADSVAGRANPWSDLLDPARKKIRGALWDYLAENRDYPYYLVRDRFAGAEGRSLRARKRGHGKILEIDGKLAPPSGLTEPRTSFGNVTSALWAPGLQNLLNENDET